jgi:hypothetical protein
VAALAVLGSAAGAPKAGADTVLLNTSNAGNQAFAMSAGPSLLDLGSGTQFFFGVVRPTRLAILFAAECATNAAGTTVWVDLDILVDGVAVPESDDVDDAFCTSTSGGAPLPDEWVSVGHHVTIDLNFGHHFVEVRGRLSGGVPTDLWQIGDLSLSLIGQER